MQELVVDEARAELAPTQADVSASLQHAQNKATALVQAAVDEGRLANRRAEDALRSAKLAIAGAKRKARMKIEQACAVSHLRKTTNCSMHRSSLLRLRRSRARENKLPTKPNLKWIASALN
jgi:hypothetical protein